MALIAAGIAAVALAPFLWRELYPPALREAEAAFRRDDYVAALSRAMEHLRRRPRSRSASLIAAKCLSRLNQADRAEPLYGDTSELGLEDLHVRAFGLVRGNHRDRAVAAYLEILERHPRDVLALRRLAGVYISQSRWDDALEVARRLIAIPEGAVIGHSLAGVVHHDTQSPERAHAEFEEVLKLDPELRRMPLPRTMFLMYLGQDLMSVGRAEDARRQFLRALEGGRDPYAMDLIGQTYWMQGEFDDAERSWLRSIEWDDGRSWPWLLLGKLDLQRNRPAEAVERLVRAVELAPGAYEPAYSLSLAYRRSGRAEDAARLKEQADRLREASAPHRGGMGPPPSPKP